MNSIVKANPTDDGDKGKHSWLEFSALIMGVSIPVLYLIGYFFQMGYLSAFNVDSGFFAKTVADYLVTSFHFFARGIIYLWNTLSLNLNFIIFLFTFIGIYLFVIVLIFLISKSKASIIKRFILRAKNASRARAFWLFIFPPVVSAFAVFVLVAIVTLLIALILLLVSIYSHGENIGTEDKSGFEACPIYSSLNANQETIGNVGYRRCVYLFSSGNLVISGMLIDTSSDNVAIWDGIKSVIYPIEEGIHLEVIDVPIIKKPNSE